jgi:hypothetical protein
MTDSTYYCPLSARINRGVQPLYSPPDAQPERIVGADESVEVAEEHHLLQSDRIEDASDALFDAYDDEGQVWLVSRVAFDLEDIELITDELLRAASKSATTGVITSRITDHGYVLVRLDYRPIADVVRSADDARTVFADLRKAHAQEVVHGGINDRFVNPNADEGRKVFGFGLTEAYAAWRRKQGIEIGDVVADPRFASPEALRGETPNPRDDRYALAAVCLTELVGDPEELPTLAPVQGVNAFLNRAGSVTAFAPAFSAVGDDKTEKLLESSLLYEEEAERPVWMLPIAIALGAILLLQVFGFFRSPSVEVEQPEPSASQTESVICAGRGVTRSGNECRIADNTGRCGEGTRLVSSSGECVPVTPPSEQADAESEEDSSEEEEEIASPYIHPVLSCPENQSRLSYKFSFSNDDINLTLGEKGALSRLAERCESEASVVYYTSSPGLEDRAQTIFEEFRSSSICGEACKRIMPARPTSVVYVPNIDMLDRANEHYMFFQCCEN